MSGSAATWTPCSFNLKLPICRLDMHPAPSRRHTHKRKEKCASVPWLQWYISVFVGRSITASPGSWSAAAWRPWANTSVSWKLSWRLRLRNWSKHIVLLQGVKLIFTLGHKGQEGTFTTLWECSLAVVSECVDQTTWIELNLLSMSMLFLHFMSILYI